MEDIGLAKLSYPFKMEIDFVNDPTGCDCACGEYLQRVKGFFERDNTGTGSWEKDRLQLTYNVFLRDDKLQEDGIPGREEYGHRFWEDDTRLRPKPNEKDDAFLKNTRATGCEYRGSDEPGMVSKRHRAKIRMYLEFVGGAVDVCEVPGERRVMLPHQRSWIIHGQAQVKAPPPGPIKPATDSPSTTTTDITEAEETDIRQGRPLPSWYAGGILSHATSGEYRMVVGFNVGGTTKYSLVRIRIVASYPDSIFVITTNKRNVNLNPDDPKNPVIVEPNHPEQIQRSILEKVEQALTP